VGLISTPKTESKKLKMVQSLVASNLNSNFKSLAKVCAINWR